MHVRMLQHPMLTYEKAVHLLCMTNNMHITCKMLYIICLPVVRNAALLPKLMCLLCDIICQLERGL